MTKADSSWALKWEGTFAVLEVGPWDLRIDNETA